MTLEKLIEQLKDLLEKNPSYASYKVVQYYEICCIGDVGTIEKIDENKQMIYLGESLEDENGD